MILDMRTIIFMGVLTNLVCLLVIMLMWQQNHRRFAGTTFWVVDFALQATAFFLIVLRGIVPDWASMLLSNTLAMIGALLGYMGLLRFTQKKGRQIHNYVLLAVFVGIHSYFTFVQPNLALRNLNISLVLLVIFFQCLWLLFYRVGPQMRQLTRGVGIVFGVYCLLNIIRIGHILAGTNLESNFMQSGTFEALILASYNLLLILLAYSLALMFNKRLLSDIGTQEEKFSRAFHASPYAITITRASDGQIIEVNEGFEKITGYTIQEVKGKNTTDLHLWAREEDRAPVVNELLRNSTVHNRKLHFRKKTGEMVTGLFSADTIAINDEVCILSSINDITEHKEAESKIREQLVELQRWQDVMLDREERVEELKREVNTLNRRMGEAPRYPGQEPGAEDTQP